MPETAPPWYQSGLAFECTRCGACCTGAPGFVWVDEAMIADLAAFLGMEPTAFSKKYVRRVGDRYSLVERPGGDCIFWSKDVGCTVYPARPVQCRTWPFWDENLASPADWKGGSGAAVPGVGRGRVFYGMDEIREAAALADAPREDETAGPPLDPSAFRGELGAIYARLDAEIQAAGPSCGLSGRCCRFAEYGHTLFVSAPEFGLLLADAPPPPRAVDDGETCPWQDAWGRCSAREARPIGCRVYFCDPSFEDRGPELTERYLAEVGALADRLGLPRDYAPLHRHLEAAVASGALPDALASADARPSPIMSISIDRQGSMPAKCGP